MRDLSRWQQPHKFALHDAGNERRTLWVVLLTLFMMAAEITAGLVFGSIALLADGWHMGTHAAALGITLVAYYYARRMANDARFTFGTGKMGVLAGYSSAIVLLIVALLMVYESVQRLLQPLPIRYDEAILVAVLGLSVNLFSAFLLRDNHDHGHGHAHEHNHGHTDHNLRAAYLHVLADALTSVLAIAALLAGKMFGWVWMDAAVGIIGAGVITCWSVGLMRDTGSILLDRAEDNHVSEEITQLLEADADNRIADLHVWKISSNQYSAALTLVTENPRPIPHYRKLLEPVEALVHVTIEVHRCEEEQGATGVAG